MPWSDKVLLTALVHGGKAIQQHMHGRGVYELLLGNEIVYFGATCRGRFGDRIIKHCIKLIGWDVGGVAVAGKWREFLDGRQNDLADMSARTLSTTSPPLALGIEAYLIKEYRTRTKHLPLLNARCPKYKITPKLYCRLSARDASRTLNSSITSAWYRLSAAVNERIIFSDNEDP